MDVSSQIPERVTGARVDLPKPGDMLGMGRVLVKFGVEAPEVEVFDFYPDELAFRAEEFLHKTLDECHDLFARKDAAYLRS